MKIYIVGLGLIGGSMALDIQRLYENALIIGIDSNENHLNEALSLGLIHQKGNLDDNLDGDFVILAVPVDVALVLLPKILDIILENTIVIDVGSTKKPICDAVENHPKRGTVHALN